MKSILKLFSLFLLALVILCCAKDKKNNDVNLVDKNYTGYLQVHFTNTYPTWDVTTQMEATIDKDFQTILFSSGALNYSGTTIIEADSKIEREGTWQIQPVGFMEKAGDDISISVDGGVTITYDVQRINALVNGNWQLVNETNFASAPNSDLIFSLNEAVLGSGSKCEVTTQYGSILWTLYLAVSLVQ